MRRLPIERNITPAPTVCLAALRTVHLPDYGRFSCHIQDKVALCPLLLAGAIGGKPWVTGQVQAANSLAELVVERARVRGVL